MQKLINYLAEKYQDDSSGHDFEHLARVVSTSKIINEDQDEFMVELTAWLHDSFDEKFYVGDMETDLRLLLKQVEIELSDIDFRQLLEDLENFGYHGGFTKRPLSKVGQIVEDSDRLDAIGAIGIARACMYGGYKGHQLYDRVRDGEPLESYEQYRSNRSIIQHFDDKLFKLKDLMNTEKGYILATERHMFMEQFIKQLKKEINRE